jgi:hypothetical protein
VQAKRGFALAFKLYHYHNPEDGPLKLLIRRADPHPLTPSLSIINKPRFYFYRRGVQVLRLMEVFRADEVAAAVRDAITRGAIGFDAVKHLVLCRIERRPPRLDMTVYPYLPQAHVAMTSAKTYLGLLVGAAS